MTVEDYMGIIRRHFWLLIIPPIVICAASYAVSLKIPNRYESKTLVLVDEQRVPDSVVKSVITGDPNQRLASMQEQILSRTRLEPIVEKFGLFGERGGTIEDKVNDLRKDISVIPIAPMAETRTSGLPGFHISVILGDARTAQQVCSEVTTMFVEEDLKSREQDTEGTVDFLNKQVAEAQQKMNDQDAKLAEFKRRYLGELPEEEQTNLGLLTGVNVQLDAINQAIERARESKSMFESMLTQQLAAWKASQQSQQTGIASPAALDVELKQKQDELAKLQEMYYDDFPNVKAKKAEIEELKKKIAAADAAKSGTASSDSKDKPVAAASAIEPAEIQQLRLQINAANMEIQEKLKEQKKMEDSLNAYQSRIQSSPVVEQQYKELTRDSTTAQEDYNKLLHNRDDAAMSADLERRQQGQHFTILDSASFPTTPTYPNRLLFVGGGFGGGLALGVALILLLEMRDRSIRTEADVELFLKLPTLAMVPSIASENGIGSRFIFRPRKEKPTLPANV